MAKLTFRECYEFNDRINDEICTFIVLAGKVKCKSPKVAFRALFDNVRDALNVCEDPLLHADWYHKFSRNESSKYLYLWLNPGVLFNGFEGADEKFYTHQFEQAVLADYDGDGLFDVGYYIKKESENRRQAK